MKKLILFALTLVLAGSLLTACRWGDTTDTSESTDNSAATTQPATTQPTTAPMPTVPDNIPDNNMSDPAGNGTEGTGKHRVIDNRI